MNQIKVQWVLPEKLADGVETDEAVLRKFGYVPVIELAALAEVVEGLKMIANEDYAAMLATGVKVEHRGSIVLQGDCELEGSYDEDARYSYPSRALVVAAMAQRLLAQVGALTKEAE